MLPTLGAGITSSFTGGDAGDQESHQANLSLTSFEIDLFGRLRNQTASAFETWLASEEGRGPRTSPLSLKRRMPG